MPMEVRDVNGGLGVIIVGRGVVTDKEYIDAIEEHLSQDPDKYVKYRYALCDYTAVTKVEVSTSAICRVVEMCRRAAEINPHAVLAVVADRDLTYGLARMAQLLRDDGTWEEMVFRNRKEAETWLRETLLRRYNIDHVTFS